MTQATIADRQRFGEILVEMGLVTPADVATALHRQAEMRQGGENARLGVLLVEMGCVGAELVLVALSRQGKRLLRCPGCDRSWNVQGDGGGREDCPDCGQALVPPSSEAELLRALAAFGTRSGASVTGGGGGPGTTSSGRVPAGAPPSPGSHFGRYRLERMLGEGGMGQVWKAWDTGLERWIALKWIREGLYERATGRERFEREARACAGLRHPGLVSVLDIGECEGRRYLTMEYVEGPTLSERWRADGETRRAGGAIEVVRLREQVELLAQVAAAADYAHRSGVLHRDLKPSNVLIDAAGRARVTDFGLARDLGATVAPGLTLAGQAVGSPCYMSPEQAAGESNRLAPTTDVWALGVMLYEALTGRTPFEDAGEVVAVMRAVVEQEPVAPRACCPGVPRELEAIALRALEKEPSARIPTAGAFEDELRRWLRGEPVQTPLRTRSGRIGRWVRRRSGIFAGTTIAVLAALAIVIGAAALEQRAAEQVRAMLEEVGRSVEAFEDSVMRTPMTPEARVALAEQPMALLATLGRLTGESGMVAAWRARLLHLQGRGVEADAELERALALAPDDPRPRYFRGLRALEAYGNLRGMPTFHVGLGFVKIDAGREDTEAEESLRERGLADLEIALERSAGVLEGRESRTARALGYLYSPRKDGFAEALALLDGEEHPAAWRLRGLALFYLGRADEAAEAFTRALEVWPEDLVARRHRGLARMSLGLARTGPGGDPDRDFESAAGDFQILVDRDPLGLDGHAYLGILSALRGRVADRRGADPREWFERAVRSLGVACERTRGADTERGNRSRVLVEWADADGNRGVDPMPRLRLALADCEEALRQQPGSVRWRVLRGSIHRRIAAVEGAHGRDPREGLLRAIRDGEVAIEAGPGIAEAWIERGQARMDFAEADGHRGGDPRADLRRAVADFDAALGCDPGQVGAVNARGVAHMILARAETARGGDATSILADAERDFTAVLQQAPESVDAWNNLGQVSVMQADALARRGGDPREAYLRAIGHFDEMLRRHPGHHAGFVNRGRARIRLGEADAAFGRDPGESARLALADLDAALAVNPRAPEAFANRASAHRLLAHDQQRRGRDPMDEYRAAVADAERACALDSGNPERILDRGVHFLRLAEAEAQRQVDNRESLERALRDFREVLRVNPDSASAHMNCSGVWIRLAEARGRYGGDARAALAGAIEAAQEATKRVPGLVGAHSNRGMARLFLADLEAESGEDPLPTLQAALADLDHSVRLRPADAGALNLRGRAWFAVANVQSARGEDASPALRRAEEDLRAAVERHDVNARMNLGLCLQAQGRVEEAIEVWDAGARAAPALAKWVDDQVAETLREKRPWEGRLADAARARASADRATERRHLEAAVALIGRWLGGLPAAERDAAIGAALPLRETYGAAHGRLAGLLARASAGGAGSESEALRDAAFSHLEAAESMGWRVDGAPGVAADFAPLHADPRWGARPR